MSKKLTEEEFIDLVITTYDGVIGALEDGLTADRLIHSNSEFARSWRKLERIYGADFRSAFLAVEKIMFNEQ